MNISEYLERIHIHKIERPSYSFLSKLQQKHLLTVPFENLDIHEGKKIVLDDSILYEKIVSRGRGGFCYELNGLFCWLLRTIGFTAQIVSARVYMPARNLFSPEFDHMAILVDLGDRYLVDVGFGDTFRRPIAMPDGAVADVSGKYQIRSDKDQFVLQKLQSDDWQPVYRFTIQPKAISDFEEMCSYNQTSPESHFTQQIICTIATETGRVSLSDDYLTITEGDKKKKIKVMSSQDFGLKLQKYFGIQRYAMENRQK
jgi:N-hydroxyarylamine O-acetyltransferase